MSILFINGSPNKKGNTARLAAALLGSHDYETLNLTDYRINVYGQRLAGDQFDEVMAKIKAADTIVIGSPLYWHNICGSVRTLLDRFYGPAASGSLRGKTLYFLFQGAAPEQWSSTQANSPCSALLSSMGFPGAVWRRRRGKRGRYLNKSEQRFAPMIRRAHPQKAEEHVSG